MTGACCSLCTVGAIREIRITPVRELWGKTGNQPRRKILYWSLKPGSNRKKERERNTMSPSQLTPTSAYENTELSANVPVGSYRAETPHLLWIKVLMQGLFFFFCTPDLRDPLCTCTNTDWQSMCPFAIHLSVLAPSCRLIHHVKWCRLKLCGPWLWHTAGHQKSPSPSGLCNIAFKNDW